MIIVSQDKRDVLNFDFTQRIGLDRETNFTSIVAYQNGNAEVECMWLGSYKTEERAKKVLQEIIRKAEDLSWANLMDNLQIAIHDKNFGGALSNTYYIPEE